LLAYLARASDRRGAAKALRATSKVVELSASPMETYDEMLLCLPPRLGGYNILLPEMNHPIVLDPRAARIARRDVCYEDMSWLDGMLDVEHHGRLDHSSPEDVMKDRARVTGLQAMGVTVIELTAQQVFDLDAFETIAIDIAKRVGFRIRPQRLGATPARVELRRLVREWNESYGNVLAIKSSTSKTAPRQEWCRDDTVPANQNNNCIFDKSRPS